MKSVHYKYATKKDREETFVSAGEPFKPIKHYTKDDFLTPGQVGEKFNISTENAEKLMRLLKKKNSLFVANGHMSPIVMDMGKNGILRLHPLAIEAFQKHLDKQRG